MSSSDGPLLVFGRRSATYDFGPSHPFTPRRFGPGIDLLRELGAQPGLQPQPATDMELASVHTQAYIEAVRRFSVAPVGEAFGIGTADVPAFAGMHEAAAAVAGGSLRATEAILRGDVEHAFHPGGGLHHAMPGRAAGFCVYSDLAVAIARARAAGLRVLYLDFDVHHGDGVEAIHRADPGVVTFSLHESGRTLFPGTGGVALGDEGPAVGTAVNLPLFAGTGAGPWLAAVERLVPEIAAAFGPDLVVSQHGSDSHALDPLAHLRVTTTAMGAAARLTDAVAHRHAGGRWLATGGGGYDVYRVVPRAWSLVWLAAAHRPAPQAIPAGWRERWSVEAARYGQGPPPDRLEDDEALGATEGDPQVQDRTAETAGLVRSLVVPALIRQAVDAGWWTALDSKGPLPGDARSRRSVPAPGDGMPQVLAAVDAQRWDRLRLARGVAGPADPGDGHRLVAAALASGDRILVTAAVVGDLIVGLAVSVVDGADGVRRLLALGVAAPCRRVGLGRAIFTAHINEATRADDQDGRPRRGIEMLVTAAERDPFEPLARDAGAAAARSILVAAGFEVVRAPGRVGLRDPRALLAHRPA